MEPAPTLGATEQGGTAAPCTATPACGEASMETTKVLEERWLALEAEYAAINEADLVRAKEAAAIAHVRAKEAAAIAHVIVAEGEEALELEEKQLEAQLEYGGYDSFDDYDRLDGHYPDLPVVYFLEEHPLP
ncbi:hypothetical protein M885DRAFT_575412 [Pelagophyceae sp. CCMP2097]|nr:hypothetical protein M885DRAFT_575412 [Pelagophyceae sp. CCMP2097]